MPHGSRQTARTLSVGKDPARGGPSSTEVFPLLQTRVHSRMLRVLGGLPRTPRKRRPDSRADGVSVLAGIAARSDRGAQALQRIECVVGDPGLGLVWPG